MPVSFLKKANPRTFLSRRFASKRQRRYSPAMLSRIRRQEKDCGQLDDSTILSEAVGIREDALDRTPHQEEFEKYTGLLAESVFRACGFRLHDVQLQAIVESCTSSVAEMQTGEGKTIVTAAAAAVNSLTAHRVHVATTNAYLAHRDADEVTPVLERMGLSCGKLPEGHDIGAAKAAYATDITYGPGYQFGFDYLRDQVFLRTNRQSQLGRRTINAIKGKSIAAMLMQTEQHHTMLVDEADSVMIDEAVTPLVISGAARGVENRVPFDFAHQLAKRLVEDEDFERTSPGNQITLKDHAEEHCHKMIEDKDFELARPWRIYITNALRANHVFQRNIDYVVRNGEIQIVDQYTGRIFDDRTWQDGLHQAVEAKEGVEIKSAPPTVAGVTRQRYFQLYEQLTGLTGTAAQVAGELKSVYGMDTICIPTNLPCIRQKLPARFFRDCEAKLAAVAEEIQQRHKTGQPILVGTRTISESIQIRDRLISIGVDAVVLNGLQDAEEAEIVSAAGQWGAITIATNMAGRGTDIKIPTRSLEVGGLHVLGYSPNASYRIDRQLAGRSARQGNPGSVQFFVAADDETVEHYSTKLSTKIARRSAQTGESQVSFERELLALQNSIETIQYESRQSLMRSDKWMDLVRETIDKE